MSDNPFIAQALLRAKRPTFELGLEIRREEEEEFRLAEERRRGIETRERKRGVARGRGRWGGGLLGLLLAGAAPFTGGASLLAAGALSGLGSYLGQRGAVAIAPGARRKFERIGPGRYSVGRGEEREREFEWGERERERYFREEILTSAAMDALSAVLGTRYAGTKGYGSILDMILGRGAGAALPGYAPEASMYPSIT